MATPVRVQSGSANTAGASQTTLGITFGSAPTNGNDLVCFIFMEAGTRSVSSISQTGAPSWARLYQIQSTARGVCIEVWGATNVSGAATTATITISGASAFGVIFMEYSGLSTTTMLDQSTFGTGTTSPASSGTTSSTNAATEVWLTGAGVKSAAGTTTFSSPTGGFSIVQQWADAHTFNACVCELIVSTTGAAGNSVTLSGDSSYSWVDVVATLFPPPTPGTQPEDSLALMHVG